MHNQELIVISVYLLCYLFIYHIYYAVYHATSFCLCLLKKANLINPLSANPENWPNTLKHIVGNLPTICLSVFDHFMNLALKGLKSTLIKIENKQHFVFSEK